jgi:hypothetical protein
MTQRLVFTIDAAASSAGELPPVPCPFCGRDAHRQDDPRMFDGSLWRCGGGGAGGCGALGLSCMPADLDETSEQFFDVLGLADVSFSEPAVPVGRSGHLSIQHYDSPKLLRQLIWFFEGRGDQTAFHEVGYIYRMPDGRAHPEHTSWFFWIKAPAS